MPSQFHPLAPSLPTSKFIQGFHKCVRARHVLLEFPMCIEEVVPAMLEPILVRHGYADSNVMYVSRDNNFDCIEVSSDTN